MTIRGFSAPAVPGTAAFGARPPQLDRSQRAVVELGDGSSAAVAGAPGSGKTTTLVELVADRVLNRGWSPDEIVVLAANRGTATRLRDRLAVRLGVPSRGPLARTANSLAFEAVVASAKSLGVPSPTLLTGGDQDSLIAQLLDGDIAEGIGPEWPEELRPDVRALRAFRSELREFMMRATEHELDAPTIEAIGLRDGRPEWVAAARFITEYLGVVEDQSPLTGARLDSAELAAFAVRAIAEGDAGERISGLRLAVVDDLQDASESTIALLRALAARGVAVVAFGDADVATSVFRGGEVDTLGRFGSRIGVPAAGALTLDTVHRHTAAIRAVSAATTGRIGAAASGRQRAALAADDPRRERADDPRRERADDPRCEGEGRELADEPTGRDTGSDPVGTSSGRPGARPEPVEPVLSLIAPTPAREAAGIARHLRERHLRDGVAWRDMVVVVRSGAAVGPLARALTVADVPTRTSIAGRPLREDPAARALLTVVDAAIHPEHLDAATTVELLTGPFGGLDRVGLRRLRLALRVEEIAGGGSRGSDELLVEALGAPGRFATIDSAAARRGERLAGSLDAVRGLHAENGSVEELLWSAWEKSRLGASWYESALGTGLAAAEANRNLDGVVALFLAARRFVERSTRHSAAEFINETLRAEVPDDTLAPRADDDAVLVATPSAVVGLEFDTAVVARLQDGVWPNLRIRGSLLDPAGLVAAAARGSDEVEFDPSGPGPRSAGAVDGAVDLRKQTLDDELRMFALAVSRPREQLVLSAVSGEDESLSMFFRLLPPDVPRVPVDGRVPLSLRGATAALRRRLTSRAGRNDAAAASALRLLADEKIPGAAPSSWLGMLEPSSTEPLYDLDDAETRVPVSPSKLEAFEESPLNWFIDTVSGSSTSTAMGIGTVVHWVLENASEPDAELLWEAVEQRWSELVFEAPWLAERQKRATRVLVDGLADYLADFGRSGGEVVAREGRFTLDLGPARVRGSIDRVERTRDGGVTIVDLKTGRSHPSSAAIAGHAQLGSYQLAVAHGAIDALAAPGETERGRASAGERELADAAETAAAFAAGSGDPRHALREGSASSRSAASGPAPSSSAKLLYVAGGVRGKRYRELVQEQYTPEQLDELRERIRLAAIGMAASEFAGQLDAAPFSPGEALRYVIHTIPEVTSR